MAKEPIEYLWTDQKFGALKDTERGNKAITSKSQSSRTTMSELTNTISLVNVVAQMVKGETVTAANGAVMLRKHAANLEQKKQDLQNAIQWAKDAQRLLELEHDETEDSDDESSDEDGTSESDDDSDMSESESDMSEDDD
jgi:hypothetical protein